jgi:hypothetical protein
VYGPLILGSADFLEPQDAQVRFHMDRIRRLVDYFPLVFDGAHWWIHVL